MIFIVALFVATSVSAQTERKKVAVVPGDAFGACGEGFVRVSYAYSINHLREAVKRIGEFLEELKDGKIQ